MGHASLATMGRYPHAGYKAKYLANYLQIAAMDVFIPKNKATTEMSSRQEGKL
jgi:hypothetical protein